MLNNDINFLWANTTSAVDKLYYAQHDSIFGPILIAATEHGLSALDFNAEKKQEQAIKRLMKKWPQAKLVENPSMTKAYAEQVFSSPEKPEPITLHIFGSAFQQLVWQELTDIPFGELVTCKHIADNIGSPSEMAKVGSAIGSNPVAFMIPCHRAIASDEEYGDYHWGKKLKKKIISWERQNR